MQPIWHTSWFPSISSQQELHNPTTEEKWPLYGFHWCKHIPNSAWCIENMIRGRGTVQVWVTDSITEKCRRYSYIFCAYLLVEICWPSQSACAVADVGLTAADWDTVVPGFFKPAGIPPVRVVVDTTAVKLGAEQSRMLRENLPLLGDEYQIYSQITDEVMKTNGNATQFWLTFFLTCLCT